MRSPFLARLENSIALIAIHSSTVQVQSEHLMIVQPWALGLTLMTKAYNTMICMAQNDGQRDPEQG
jgi:hypothetical protein